MAALVVSEANGVKILKLSGRLTCEGVDQITPMFTSEAQGPIQVIVDLSGVDMVATPGITMLLAADRSLKDAGGKMILTGTQDFVQEVIHRCRLDLLWTVIRDPNEAIRQAGQVQ